MMLSKLGIMAVLLGIAVACTQSEDSIQRQEEHPGEIFRENSAPDNLERPRGSTEFDAVGTEDAITQ